ncbi:soluble NSF attachment protein [Yarrowia lipolytica]|jgi:alpha-soluble NSF attachment protein|uniref:YALI0C23947p n=2 Tax=Yarrowia lipolytica TaxID=4952 RepID=Q6CAV9_YARLI|nr:YALI0C23947p [Yarrowia lipolytica CLIB122]AOW03333.1 hypothetical protein YALI1_C32975g [Yarrowia lipolytica]KAB8280264.1 soluble NSF attachment protein [Yarrowia lipolytica]KAE8169347.1 soluble NSF attachment protein [Yarrowia lipolytica]KAJ8053814.1 soluble NSF attachment protein [Yarrowia lipolytica]QNP96014.1 Vesicular-fusion protein SEC17 [Yarrowia lipolytica]|eukprot:XP_502203.1 YALI0C23947p [Yarrowia lipolytica CLIB122]
MSDVTALIARADKKMTSSGGMFSFMSGGSSTRFEEAADLYTEAANQYKLQRNGKLAGECFEKAADAQLQSESKDEAANSLLEAYKSYRSNSPQEAAKCLEKAIQFFTTRGQFRRGANYKMELGELYEKELEDIPKAMEAYTDAGDWFSEDRAETLSSKAYLKVAELSAENDDLFKAIEMFEMVARRNLNSNIMKWSLKEYLFKAGLCRIAADPVACGGPINAYLEWDPAFGQSREYGLLVDICEAVSNQNPQLFADKVYDFDQFSKLDKWKTNLLLKIKNAITEQEDDEGLL